MKNAFPKTSVLHSNTEGLTLYGLFRLGTDLEETGFEKERLYSSYLMAIEDAKTFVSQLFKLPNNASLIQTWPSQPSLGQDVFIGWENEWVACVRQVGSTELSQALEHTHFA